MSIDMKKLCSIRNRNNGFTTYQLPDLHIVRTFGRNEVKKVPYDELLALYYAPGGEYMLNNLLIVEDKEVLDALNMRVEPEYFYTADIVKKLLFEGSYDAFADFLDFAPEGAIEMAKEIAVKEQIPDSRKREMIEKKTGFSIDNAIKVNKIIDAETENNAAVDQKRQRRASVPKEEPVTVSRRTTPIVATQYKVVEKKESSTK